MFAVRRFSFLMAIVAFLMATGCTKTPVPTDHPRLTPNVVLQDITFQSPALSREMQYRVIFPAKLSPGQKLPVVYLLHGRGGGYRDWSNYSDVARFAESGLLLVMPEGASSYYANAVDPPQDRYEDYIVHDLINDVSSRFPVAEGRANRAILGVSMGGFGAVNLALRHLDMFMFVGGISSAIDVPRRPFTIRRFQQSRHFNSIFGPHGSQTRRDHDPLILIRAADPNTAPYFFLTCGEQEGLLPSNREFASLLSQRQFKYEFHTVHGDHDWNQWNAWLPVVFRSLSEHLQADSRQTRVQ